MVSRYLCFIISVASTVVFTFVPFNASAEWTYETCLEHRKKLNKDINSAQKKANREYKKHRNDDFWKEQHANQQRDAATDEIYHRMGEFNAYCATQYGMSQYFGPGSNKIAKDIKVITNPNESRFPVDKKH